MSPEQRHNVDYDAGPLARLRLLLDEPGVQHLQPPNWRSRVDEAFQAVVSLCLPDPHGGCACVWHPPSNDPAEPHISFPPELEYEPACPVHSHHVYNPRTGVWDLAEAALRYEPIAGHFCGQSQPHGAHDWRTPEVYGSTSSVSTYQCGGLNATPTRLTDADREALARVLGSVTLTPGIWLAPGHMDNIAAVVERITTRVTSPGIGEPS